MLVYSSLESIWNRWNSFASREIPV